jgi:membrane protease YdiL (CAAX protease family)
MADDPPCSTLILNGFLAKKEKTIKALIEGHPLLSYFALVFAISWGAILIVVGLGPGGFSATPKQFQNAIPYAVPAMVLGPGVAGIVLTGIVHGREGLREFRSRLLKWRVGARWYALALLTAPLVYAAVFVPLSLISPEFLPRIFITSDKASVLLMGIAAGLVAGIFEELGWTGFAILRMRLRYGVLATGLFVGVLWAAWHLLQRYWASGVTLGELSLALWLANAVAGTLVGSLVAYRVLMVWVYDHTGGSLPVAMLMHVSLTFFTIIIGPSPLVISGVALLTYGHVLAAAWWVVVAGVAMVQGGHLLRKPNPKAGGLRKG